MNSDVRKVIDWSVKEDVHIFAPITHRDDWRKVTCQLCPSATQNAYRILQAVRHFAGWLEMDSIEMLLASNGEAEPLRRVSREELLRHYQGLFGKADDEIEAARYWHKRCFENETAQYL